MECVMTRSPFTSLHLSLSDFWEDRRDDAVETVLQSCLSEAVDRSSFLDIIGPSFSLSSMPSPTVYRSSEDRHYKAVMAGDTPIPGQLAS